MLNKKYIIFIAIIIVCIIGIYYLFIKEKDYIKYGPRMVFLPFQAHIFYASFLCIFLCLFLCVYFRQYLVNADDLHT